MEVKRRSQGTVTTGELQTGAKRGSGDLHRFLRWLGGHRWYDADYSYPPWIR